MGAVTRRVRTNKMATLTMAASAFATKNVSPINPSFRRIVHMLYSLLLPEKQRPA